MCVCAKFCLCGKIPHHTTIFIHHTHHAFTSHSVCGYVWCLPVVSTLPTAPVMSSLLQCTYMYIEIIIIIIIISVTTLNQFSQPFVYTCCMVTVSISHLLWNLFVSILFSAAPFLSPVNEYCYCSSIEC